MSNKTIFVLIEPEYNLFCSTCLRSLRLHKSQIGEYFLFCFSGYCKNLEHTPLPNPEVTKEQIWAL